MDYPVVDWVLAAVLVMSFIIGAWRGFLYEVLSLAGWVAAFFVAQWWAQDVAAWLPLADMPEPWRYATGFALVFIAAAFAAGGVAWLVKRVAESIGLRLVDRTLGAVFGLLRGVVILLALGVVVGMTPMRQSPYWQASRGAAMIESNLQALSPLLPTALSSHFN